MAGRNWLHSSHQDTGFPHISGEKYQKVPTYLRNNSFLLNLTSDAHHEVIELSLCETLRGKTRPEQQHSSRELTQNRYMGEGKKKEKRKRNQEKKDHPRPLKDRPFNWNDKNGWRICTVVSLWSWLTAGAQVNKYGGWMGTSPCWLSGSWTRRRIPTVLVFAEGTKAQGKPKIFTTF